MIVAGIGCRSGCPAREIVAVVEAAQAQAGCRVDKLAAPALKKDEAGLIRAARWLRIELDLVESAAMQAVQARCPTASPRALAATGFASVAEAAALASSGGTLLLARIAHARATCALASA
jgi:cobalt-precorrin 5A hydrolase